MSHLPGLHGALTTINKPTTYFIVSITVYTVGDFFCIYMCNKIHKNAQKKII